MTRLTRVSRRRRFPLGGLAIVATLALAGPAVAQEAPADMVVATLNGEPITAADLALAAAEFGDQLGQVAPERRDAALIDLVINIRLASKAAKDAGLESEPAVMRRLDLARDRTLYSEFLRTKFIAAVTDEAVKARFDEEIASFEPQEEVRARHILVKTEAEAKDIIAQLDKGADFAELATEASLDPGSGQSGGDLGFFKRGQMVKPFEEAAFDLKPGKYTKKPVQSDFGWHVILVEEKREEPPPTFESQAQRIQQDLIRATFDAEIETLREGATIELVTPDAPAPAPEAAN
ncbi:peptidylprolyl isomerase [Bauldia litoralis]|uniref:Parvulin-like PPIase n=1 Tax=Bauldia litoralis TaxID=665467 RepID=A0A1G6ALC1_9HYPH|nr:peptidylprolyl isomerase [Bauldia litoralis]SDB08923.1 peptidyl-prolyl cis-trans isomerase C [Bauldia litoralis]